MPPGAQVDLWLAHDRQLRDPALLGRFTQMLSAEERERVARRHFPEDRHQQLVTRAMVRAVLSGYVPEIAPADWSFGRNAHGRPAIANPVARPLHFNLAHTPGLVVLAVASVPEVGVDVEHAGKRPPLAIARRYFSAVEIEALHSLPPEQQPRRFLRLWTLKESYLKAVGTGVVGGLGSMTFHLDDAEPRFERAADVVPERWAFREFELAGEYLLALAFLDRVDGEPPEVSFRQFPRDLA